MHRTLLFRLVLCGALLLTFLEASAGQAKTGGELDLFRCWKNDLNGAAGSLLATDGTMLFVGTADGEVQAWAVDGRKIWSSEFGGDVSSDLASVGNSLFLVTSTSGADDERESSLRSVSKETGITAWTKPVPAAAWHRILVYRNFLLLAAGSGSITMIEPKDGSVIWERKISPGWSAYPAVADDRVILASTTRQVYVVTLPGGRMESVKTMPSDVTVLAAAEGVIYTGDSQGRISRFENGAEKAKWRFRSGGEVSSLSLVDGHIMAASHDNFIYYVDAVRGGVAWKRRLAGRAIFAADYLGQYALTAVYDAHAAMLLDLNNGKPAGQILLPADEVPVAPPVISNGYIYVLTNGALNAYSKTACTQKNGSTGN